MNRRRFFGVSCAGLGVLALTLASQLGASQKPETTAKADFASDTYVVLPPIYHRNLAIFPVRKAQGGTPERYITLDEGLKTGQIEVREAGANPPPLIRPRPPQTISQNSGQAVQVQRGGALQQQAGGGQVNRLVLYNHSDRKLLLISGEMVVGGKQDRIVQKDAIIPPNDKPYDLSVFCVEHGRWSGTTTQFASAALPGARAGGGGLGGGIADPTVRGAAQAKNEQQAVWDEVGKKNTQLGAGGQTTYQAARRIAIDKGEDKPYARDLEDKVPGKDIVGAIVAVNGKLIWLDVFSSSTLFNSYWPKLLQSYILEAVTVRPSKDVEDRIRWKLPTIQEAAAYLKDRSGNARFEGDEGVYKLTRIESKQHVIYELTDMDDKHPDLVHACKMEKK
jgi:hypothetical protein